MTEAIVATTKKQKDLNIRGFSSENIWDYENAFYWYSHPTRLYKLLAHYELYRKIKKLPGAIFELGVFKAASLIRFATFRSALENDFSRKIVGFDAFGKFPDKNLESESDIDFVKKFEKAAGLGLTIKETLEIIKNKNFENIELVKGNIFDTLPFYLKRNPHTKIAMLHLDMDTEAPTTFALEQLFDRIVPNGLIVFDDYNTVEGETVSVDFLLDKYKLKIKKNSINYIPSYARKPRT